MIAIILVCTNEYKYLKETLPSIYKSSYKNFKVVIVDNNSRDETIPYIEKNFPDAHILDTKKNNGYARGNNIGMRFALKSLKADYILLLNPDTVMDQDCLRNLAQKADPKTVIQPLVLLHERGRKTNLINTTGGVLNYLGFSYCDNYRQAAKKFVKDIEPALASGACMLLPAKVLKKIGELDETFFMYHEDADLSWRARLAGFNIKTIVSAKIWHKYNFSRNKNKMYFVERNRLTFLIKNYASKTLLLLLPISIINEIAVCVFALKEKWLLLKIKSYFSNFFRLNKILAERKKVQKMRKKSDRELKQYMIDQISFSEVKLPFGAGIYNYIIKIYWRLIRNLI